MATPLLKELRRRESTVAAEGQRLDAAGLDEVGMDAKAAELEMKAFLSEGPSAHLEAA